MDTLLISEINEIELHSESNVPSKTPVLQSGNVAVAEPVAELCMASSEDDSVDTPPELSCWTKVISRKLKLHKEPAKKAVIPIVGGGVRKKTAPVPVVGTQRKNAPNIESRRSRSSS